MSVPIPCVCPPKADGTARHEHDEVTLREKLDFRQATAIRNAVAFAKAEDDDISPAELLAILTEGYVLQGVESWTLQGLDDRGRPFNLPVTKAAIREKLLSDPLLAEPIGDAADSLYAQAILLPLLNRALASSQPSPTDESTSARTTPRKPPKPSSPSSTTTIQTGGTAKITALPGGASSSSPSSASAA